MPLCYFSTTYISTPSRPHSKSGGTLHSAISPKWQKFISRKPYILQGFLSRRGFPLLLRAQPCLERSLISFLKNILQFQYFVEAVENQMSAVETLPPKVWLHAKEKADQAFRTGHYSDAVHFYSDAVNACNSSSPTDRAKLFANRALAFQREGVPSVLLSSQTRV